MDKYYSPNENIKEYYIVRAIGEGRYGIAYLAENNQKEKYVIKQLKNDMLGKTKEKLFYEKEILKKLNDNRFPKFIEEFKDDETQGYILEYVEGKDFYEILDIDEYEFSKAEIYHIASKILDIIETLQYNNIVHRDIRISNVIMNKNKEIRLIDFGLARNIDNKKYVKEIDYWFMADFLLHLYYSSYIEENESEEKPWYEELDINDEERNFLKKLMGIEEVYSNIEEIKNHLEIIKNIS